jgi:hypothetical protein
MASSELADAVRHWVHFDNLAETLNKQVQNARSFRSQYETKVLTLLDTNNMKNAVLKVNGASLQYSTRHKPADLGWTMLEEQLHEYFRMKKRTDETAEIIDFLQKNRGGKQVEYLKKTSVSQTIQPQTAQLALPPGK